MKKVLVLFLFPILTSCDCHQNVSGTILDKESKAPIQNAKVYKVGQVYNNSITDSTGYFELDAISGGLLGCPPMEIVISKYDYVEKQISIPNTDFMEIELDKLK